MVAVRAVCQAAPQATAVWALAKTTVAATPTPKVEITITEAQAAVQATILAITAPLAATGLMLQNRRAKSVMEAIATVATSTAVATPSTATIAVVSGTELLFHRHHVHTAHATSAFMLRFALMAGHRAMEFR